MRIYKVTGFCCMLALLAGLAGGRIALAAPEAMAVDTSQELRAMPVLTGDDWKVMAPDSKLAFILGIGHVVTIEEYVLQRHPELQRKGFVAKLAEGLRGVPMNDIIQQVDAYYQKNPDDLDLPVMRVIWRQLVKPRLSSGIADQPLTRQDDDR